MSEYGKKEKRIVFTDTDHRHAQLIVRLKHDGLTQSAFFRHVISGYINSDERIIDFISDIGSLSKSRKNKSRKQITKGKKTLQDLALDDKQIDNIFDLIAEEYPDL
tara:strand:- start:195 stop:512 length:318 start_codon:yes stop_codon:yes gene_type:complete